mmetsp:Transcript_31335/g.51109  ORF Transcript_31335/g.51109 Transcript_31335/m.51109 type:complete len:116 (+) Transcript_31335:386-733(+)
MTSCQNIGSWRGVSLARRLAYCSMPSVITFISRSSPLFFLYTIVVVAIRTMIIITLKNKDKNKKGIIVFTTATSILLCVDTLTPLMGVCYIIINQGLAAGRRFCCCYCRRRMNAC